ncbi:MAG TPA: DUF2505 domain-containing protein [Amycolatopsis sp.]|nr:DUF2505 domain-containing protein [Amycolatopsis sp.]
MASRIEHRAEFPHGVSDMYAAMTSEDALHARLADMGGDNSALLEYAPSADGVSFRLRQGVGADRIPSAVRTLHRGDLAVDRRETWRIAGETRTGQAGATVSGVPGEINARTELSADGAKTLLRITGEVKIRIPLIGGKLEEFVADQITKLLSREAEFAAQWLESR